MKNFSLLSLMAIAALSASLAHAAAEADPFQQRIFYHQGELVGYKEVGPNNWIFCKVRDENGDLENPNNWKRVNSNFYEKVEDSGNVKFVISVSGPSVAGRAAKFGGQVKPKQKPSSSPKATADSLEADADHDAKAEAEYQRQDDILFPADGGEQQASSVQSSSVFARASQYAKNAALSVRNAVRDASAFTPALEEVYTTHKNEELRLNFETGHYELFENEGTPDSPKWVRKDNQNYVFASFDDHGRPNFKALDQKEEDAAEKEDGASATPNQAPVSRAVALSNPAYESDLAGINSGDAAEQAFAHVYKPSHGNVFSRALGYVADTVREASAFTPARQPRSRSVVSGERLQEPADAVGSNSPREDGNAHQTWGDMARGWAGQLRNVVSDASAFPQSNGSEEKEEAKD